MTALDFRPITGRLDTAGFCANGCRRGNGRRGSQDFGPAIARFSLAILGRPAGQFCAECKRTMEGAYVEALAA